MLNRGSLPRALSAVTWTAASCGVFLLWALGLSLTFVCACACLGCTCSQSLCCTSLLIAFVCMCVYVCAVGLWIFYDVVCLEVCDIFTDLWVNSLSPVFHIGSMCIALCRYVIPELILRPCSSSSTWHAPSSRKHGVCGCGDPCLSQHYSTVVRAMGYCLGRGPQGRGSVSLGANWMLTQPPIASGLCVLPKPCSLPAVHTPTGSTVFCTVMAAGLVVSAVVALGVDSVLLATRFALVSLMTAPHPRDAQSGRSLRFCLLVDGIQLSVGATLIFGGSLLRDRTRCSMVARCPLLLLCLHRRLCIVARLLLRPHTMAQAPTQTALWRPKAPGRGRPHPKRQRGTGEEGWGASLAGVP